MQMFWIWLAAAVVFLIIEILSPTLMFVAFGAAAAVSAVYSIFQPELHYWQIGIFCAASLIFVPITRQFAKRITQKSPKTSNVDALIGQTAMVTKTIEPHASGQVKFEGETWLAHASQTIEENTKVKIVSVTGTRLTVERI
jgi:inner membrane protein